MDPNSEAPNSQRPEAQAAFERELGERLACHAQRLGLLVQHLTGAALRQRVGIEDLMQEVYLRAVAHPEQLPAWEPPQDLGLWRYLAQIARHAVVDAARSARAAKRAGRVEALAHGDWSRADARASQILARTRGPHTRAADREASRDLRQHFEALCAEHRRVLGLRQFEGLSARETARRMGRSEAAIHSLYRRALIAWQAGLRPDQT